MADDALLHRWCDIALNERRAQRFRRRVMAGLPRARRQTWITPLRVAALAATVLGGIVVVTIARSDPPASATRTPAQQPPSITASTPIVAGPDGATVDLPGAGSIRLRAGSRLWSPAPDAPAWRLETGRALCQVDPQATTSPFRLQLTGGTITVLGTRFTAISGALGGVSVHSGRVRVRDAHDRSRELTGGERLTWLADGIAPARMLAHWPLDGSAPALPSPELRARPGTTVAALTREGAGLAPGGLLLCDDPTLLTSPVFALGFRYRATAPLGPEAKALVRRMGQTSGELDQGVYLSGRPQGDGQWQLAVSVRLVDGGHAQVRFADPYRSHPDQEIELFVVCDGFTLRCLRNGEPVGIQELPAAPRLANDKPVVLGPAPGWIRDVRIWRGAAAAPGE